ncbi:PilW family protein [Cupriavidus plantarum]|uniref:Type IV pilus assembly protein PilW n=2 Tax=Cupriavidus plantarum TaxID=942865 RepID=A0A316F1R7_9BURK|nr:PilW family protein [Cupriavidus plantarum]NYH98118.1 type IV pilus assembly protein PilW [Cupriavidus plantarum]PWK38252.1 type IV pilus assembly protein PilW [Cupriavidus plantarum]
MRQPTRSLSRRFQRPVNRHARGFTLVEVMVGMVISLLLLLAASSLFIAQQRTNATQGDVAEIHENARAISQLMQREARQAGYSDFEFANNTWGGAETIEASNDDGVNRSDSLTLRYFGASGPGADPWAVPGTPSAATPDGTAVDCTGKEVSANVLTTEVFNIVQAPDGTPWLQCVVNGVATPMFPNVESLQLLLGEDTDNNKTIDRYVRPGVADVSKVRALRISFVLRGKSTTNIAPAAAAINHFGPGYASGDIAPAGDAGAIFNLPADGRLRKHYAFYVAVRNRLN